jgi:hypothetical protein
MHSTHHEEQRRQQKPCPPWDRLVTARGPVHRGVETMGGTIEWERPDFSCPVCRAGTYPLDAMWGVGVGRMQLDVPQAAVDLATEVPYETAARLCGRLSGIAISSERMHTFTHQAAENLTALDVAPSREEIAQRVAHVAPDRGRRPVLGLGIDGA